MGEIFGNGFGRIPREYALTFEIQDINTDALRQIYGAEHFDTKGDYTMELDRKALDARMAQAADGRRVFVLDRDALSALPTDTRIKINGSSKFDVERHMVREVNGAWQWDDGENKPYGNVTKSAFPHWFFPVEVLNPELMGEFSPTFAEGEIVVIEQGALKGVRGKVVTRQYPETLVALQVIDHPKPGVDEIYLDAASLRPFDPKTDFRLGDTVRFKANLSSLGTGVITTFYGANGVRDARVKVGNVGYRVDRVGLELVAAKPEPIREEFNLTGAQVADKAGLDALPVGSVIEEATEFDGVDVRIKLRRVGEDARWFRMGLGGPSQIPLPAPTPGDFTRRVWIVKHVPGEFPAAA